MIAAPSRSRVLSRGAYQRKRAAGAGGSQAHHCRRRRRRPRTRAAAAAAFGCRTAAASAPGTAPTRTPSQGQARAACRPAQTATPAGVTSGTACRPASVTRVQRKRSALRVPASSHQKLGGRVPWQAPRAVWKLDVDFVQQLELHLPGQQLHAAAGRERHGRERGRAHAPRRRFIRCGSEEGPTDAHAVARGRDAGPWEGRRESRSGCTTWYDRSRALPTVSEAVPLAVT